jgi:ABC-type cobalamin/Fe3+-siderophores transport system ATPase subunit
LRANRQQNIEAQRVVDDIAEIFGYDRLEIDVAPDAQSLHVVADRKNYRLRELGAGLAQFLVVFGNAAMRKPSVILIDEPELHLHPSLQLEFLLSLASYAKQGVMISTHSIGLARSSTERIYSLHRDGTRSIVRPFEQTVNFVEFLGEMSFSGFKDLGHEAVLMVEGVSDVKTVQQLLRVLGHEHKVVVLPIGGSQFIADGRRQELAELQRLTKNVAILVDSERVAAQAEIAAPRKAFIEDCEALGYTVCATEFRAIENYFPEHAVREGVGPQFHALAPFEARGAKSWPKPESWRVARHMSEADIATTDVGRFLMTLA